MPVENQCIELSQTTVFDFFGKSALGDRDNRCARHLAEHTCDQSNYQHHDVSNKKSVICSAGDAQGCLGALQQPEVMD